MKNGRVMTILVVLSVLFSLAGSVYAETTEPLAVSVDELPDQAVEAPAGIYPQYEKHINDYVVRYSWDAIPGAGTYYLGVGYQFFEEDYPRDTSMDAQDAVFWYETDTNHADIDVQGNMTEAFMNRPDAGMMSMAETHFLFYSAGTGPSPDGIQGDVDTGSVIGTVTITGDGAFSVREGSNASFDAIAMASSGETYPCVVQAESGWYGLLLEDGTVGYISNKVADFSAE